MTELGVDDRGSSSQEVVAANQKLKSLIAAAISAEPGFETSGVRISVSAGYVVLEGYVTEPEQIAKVMGIAGGIVGSERVKCFLFCWS